MDTISTSAIAGIFPLWVVIQKLMGLTNDPLGYARFISMVIILIGPKDKA